MLPLSKVYFGRLHMDVQDFQSRISGSILGLECIVDSHNEFDANLGVTKLGDLNICDIRAGHHTVVRRPNTTDQDGLVLTSVISGTCSLERTTDQFEFSSGELFLCRSRERYVIETSPDVTLKSLFIPYQKIKSNHRMIFDDMNSGFHPLVDKTIASLVNPYLNLTSASFENQVLERQVESSLLGLFSGVIYNDDALSNRTSYIIKQAIDVVEENLTKEFLSPVFIAEKLGYSQRYLNKLLKAKNMSLLKMIHSFRMESIIEELLSEEAVEKPIYTISSKYCFYDNSHFSRQFKLYTGLSPKEYRKQKYTKIYS